MDGSKLIMTSSAIEQFITVEYEVKLSADD